MKGLLPLALCFVACAPSESGTPSAPSSVDASAAAVPAAVLPADGHGHAPSLAKLPGGGDVDGAYLADVDSCGACHPDLYAQQQASAHAFASFNNPVYRASVERLRTEVGSSASLACAGCHDAALLADGAMATAVSAADARAHNGVSCRLCHGIEDASADGNGSYRLGKSPLPLPIAGDPQSLLRHKEAAKPPPLSALCGSCHQSFLSVATGNPHFLRGQNELIAWADSAYSGAGASRIDSVEPKTCVQCHMPKIAATGDEAAADDQGNVSSHYFLGAHTWLAAMRGDDAQVSRTQEFLRGVATIDVLPSPVREGSEALVMDLVIRNTGVGHRFPGGVRDAANTWIEVEVLDAAGKVILRSKTGASAHRLAAYLADEEGGLVLERQTHRFAALIADHTIAPRDVAVIRYRATEGGGAGESIRARLLHQSRGPSLVHASCAESKSASGQAYAQARTNLGRPALNACAAAPITLVAEVERSVRDLGEQSFTRNYEHGLGLLHEVQERVDSARPSLERALRLAARDPERESMVLVALATLEGRLGRADTALHLLDKAMERTPKSAAIHAIQGDALARVWRWQESADAYGKASALAPGNASLWRRYAVALGSTGASASALRAAQEGLRLMPRDADLLRAQALALRHLAPAKAEEAMESYLQHRGPDNIGGLRLLCAKASAICARESMPIHEHALERANRR